MITATAAVTLDDALNAHSNGHTVIMRDNKNTYLIHRCAHTAATLELYFNKCSECSITTK